MDATARMRDFIWNGEAEEYAIKVQLHMGGLLRPTVPALAEWLRATVAEMYDLFIQLNDNQPLMADVPDLDAVDWTDLATGLLLHE